MIATDPIAALGSVGLSTAVVLKVFYDHCCYWLLLLLLGTDDHMITDTSRE